MTKERFENIAKNLIELNNWIEEIRHTPLLDELDITDIDSITRFNNAMNNNSLIIAIENLIDNIGFMSEIKKLLIKHKLSYSYDEYRDENDDIMLRIKIFSEDNRYTDPYTYNTIMFVNYGNNNVILFDYYAKSKKELEEVIKIQKDITEIMKKRIKA